MRTTWIVASFLLAVQVVSAQPVTSRTLSTNLLRSRLEAGPSVSVRQPVLTRANALAVPVDLGAVTLQNYEVRVNAGSTWRVAPEALEVSAGQTNLVVQANRQAILLPRTPSATKAPIEGRSHFPGLMVCNWSPRPGAPAQAAHGRLFLRTRQTPVPWNDQQNAYVTTLVVGLDLTNHTGSIDLEPPVSIEFFPSGAAVQPTRVLIQRTGTGGYQEATLQCPRLDESAAVLARSDMGELVHPVEMVPRFGRLEIVPAVSRVFGFGLGTTTLTVERLAEDGSGLNIDAPLTLRLSTTRGKLEPEGSMQIPAGSGMAAASLRSSGSGTALVTASADGLQATAEIRFIFPLAFIVATVIGGCAGGGGRFFRNPTRSRSKRARLIMEGCLVGAVAVAAVTAGMVIGGFPTPALGTELGAFVVAALSGYVGAPLLDRMVQRVFPSGRS
ncbi:MAG TPA: hypothetical protein VMS21_08155 [Methylomirabilota bacterium]|nr:hypothetical protein [Methylomirabilota bacterium]